MSKKGRYTEMPHRIIYSPVWNTLSCHARIAFLEITSLHNGRNNGNLVMSSRMLAEHMNCSAPTAARAVKELINKQLVEITRQPSSFRAAKRVAAAYRVMHLKCDISGKRAVWAPGTRVPESNVIHLKNGFLERYSSR